MTRWRRTGIRLVGLATVFALFVAVVPVGNWMTGILEDRFPPPVSLPDRVDGIIVLGGVLSPKLSQVRGQPSVGGAVERLMSFAGLAARYPDTRLLFTSGSGSLRYQDLKEAHMVGPVLAQFGLDPDRVVFEDQSRNTYENAVFSHRTINPGDRESWILITSAFHMPRATGSFRKAGWNVLPYPVDYTTLGSEGLRLRFNFSNGMGRLGNALHEWVGLLVYWITDKTDALFPGPESG
jgi:uncharacterized SAM-binding protein YcdF (DUF218 family)